MATGKIGISQSALSQTVRQIKARLGVRLVTRITRSVSLSALLWVILLLAGSLVQRIGGDLACVRHALAKCWAG